MQNSIPYLLLLIGTIYKLWIWDLQNAAILLVLLFFSIKWNGSPFYYNFFFLLYSYYLLRAYHTLHALITWLHLIREKILSDISALVWQTRKQRCSISCLFSGISKICKHLVEIFYLFRNDSKHVITHIYIHLPIRSQFDTKYKAQTPNSKA